MSSEAIQRFTSYYEAMLKAIKNGEIEVANGLRREMERLRQEARATMDAPISFSAQLPGFVNHVLGKTNLELGVTENSNCINAAMNFHSRSPRYAPSTTMELLQTLRSDCQQLTLRDELRWGDWVVLWSRDSGAWAERKILIDDLDPSAPGFPFGLVFDHIGVYLDKGFLFHKPDPTPESRYQINHWDDVVTWNEALPGFEITFHRLRVVGEGCSL